MNLLLERLIGVLQRAAADLERLDVYSQHGGKNDQDSLLRPEDKAAAEALLLAYLAWRLPDPHGRLGAALEPLIRRAEERLVSGRSESLLRRFPQTAASLGAAFVILGQLGRRHPTIERLLRRAMRQGYAHLSERSIFRLMDTRWTYRLWDPNLAPPVEELLPLSTLGSSPHPIYTLNEDHYALTHAVYYLTDFGCKPPPAELHASAARLLDPFLTWIVIRDDLDLLGELLIAGLALRQPQTPAFRLAWQHFFAAWDSPSGLVGPEFSPARLGELQGEQAQAYDFWENYHTRYVGGILCAVALALPAADGAPPAAAPTIPLPAAFAERCLAAAADARRQIAAPPQAPPAPPSAGLVEWAASRLLMTLDAAPDPPPPWLRTAMTCDLSRPDLAAALYDALLVEAARSYRLVQLAEALAVGAAQPALHTATFARALAFLLDQQLEDGFVGVNRLLAEAERLAMAAEAQSAIAACLQSIGEQLAAAERP